MYKEHPDIKTPPDDAILWRYLDISKFLDLLQNGALYFPSAYAFHDIFEGSYTLPMVKDRPRLYRETTRPTLEQLPRCMLNMKKTHYISCWHMNEVESAAMWKLYVQAGEGITVLTRVSDFKKAIVGNPRDIFLGEVRYIDYKIDSFSPLNTLAPFFHKRLSFSHEKEVRAVISERPPSFTGELADYLELNDEEIPGGLSLKVDVEMLINSIRISPESPDWFLALVKDIIHSKFKLNLEVERSDILRDPLH